MIDDELVVKFERIQDLPFSEEMLGAYFEEKLNSNDSIVVSDAIDKDLFLMNLSHDIISQSILPEKKMDDMMIEFDIPQVIKYEEQTLEEESYNLEDYHNNIEPSDFELPDIDYFLSSDDSFEQDEYE